MGHFYSKDGRPMHRIPKQDGSGYKATTVPDAKALGLFPSVTEKTKAVVHPGYGLINHIMQGPIDAAIEDRTKLSELYVKKPKEWEKIIKDKAKEESKKAPTLGSRVHGAFEGYLLAKRDGVLDDFCPDEDLIPYCLGLEKFLAEHNIVMEKAEQVVVNLSTFDGGTLDFKGSGFGKDLIYIDWKTQGVKKGGPAVYKDWGPQISQYVASDNENTIPKNVTGYNVIVDTNNIGDFYVKEWTYDDLLVQKKLFDYISFMYFEFTKEVGGASWPFLKGK